MVRILQCFGRFHPRNGQQILVRIHHLGFPGLQPNYNRIIAVVHIHRAIFATYHRIINYIPGRTVTEYHLYYRTTLRVDVGIHFRIGTFHRRIHSVHHRIRQAVQPTISRIVILRLLNLFIRIALFGHSGHCFHRIVDAIHHHLRKHLLIRILRQTAQSRLRYVQFLLRLMLLLRLLKFSSCIVGRFSFNSHIPRLINLLLFFHGIHSLQCFQRIGIGKRRFLLLFRSIRTEHARKVCKHLLITLRIVNATFNHAPLFSSECFHSCIVGSLHGFSRTILRCPISTDTQHRHNRTEHTDTESHIKLFLGINQVRPLRITHKQSICNHADLFFCKFAQTSVPLCLFTEIIKQFRPVGTLNTVYKVSHFRQANLVKPFLYTFTDYMTNRRKVFTDHFAPVLNRSRSERLSPGIRGGFTSFKSFPLN